MITLEIPRVPCSPNDLLGYHWRHRQRNSKLWQQEINCALVGRKPEQPYPCAYIAIVRCGHGELDEDNLTGSVKPIIDALRYAKVLVDDSPKHMTLRVTQSRCSPKVGPSTRIEIIPISLPATP